MLSEGQRWPMAGQYDPYFSGQWLSHAISRLACTPSNYYRDLLWSIQVGFRSISTIRILLATRYWICYVRRVILFCLKLYIPWDKFEMVNEFKNIEKDAWEWIHNEIVFRGKHKAICMWSILISYLSEGEKPRINRIFT